MATKLRVGIAGYGVVGKRRRECIDRNPQLETVAVSDRELSTGTMPDGIRSYSDALALLDDELDALKVTFPRC